MTNPSDTLRRRVLVQLLSFTSLVLAARPARAATPTPKQTEGPFYPTRAMRQADIDNDLVNIAGAVRQAGGQVVRLEGRVLDQTGAPVAGALVEMPFGLRVGRAGGANVGLTATFLRFCTAQIGRSTPARRPAAIALRGSERESRAVQED